MNLSHQALSYFIAITYSMKDEVVEIVEESFAIDGEIQNVAKTFRNVPSNLTKKFPEYLENSFL